MVSCRCSLKPIHWHMVFLWFSSNMPFLATCLQSSHQMWRSLGADLMRWNHGYTAEIHCSTYKKWWLTTIKNAIYIIIYIIYIYIYTVYNYMILYDIIWYYMILYDIIWYYMILYDIIWYYMILYVDITRVSQPQSKSLMPSTMVWSSDMAMFLRNWYLNWTYRHQNTTASHHAVIARRSFRVTPDPSKTAGWVWCTSK